MSILFIILLKVLFSDGLRWGECFVAAVVILLIQGFSTVANCLASYVFGIPEKHQSTYFFPTTYFVWLVLNLVVIR